MESVVGRKQIKRAEGRQHERTEVIVYLVGNKRGLQELSVFHRMRNQVSCNSDGCGSSMGVKGSHKYVKHSSQEPE